MQKIRNALPQLGTGPFLHYIGIETDIIFNRGIDLPGFASYPLLETDEGRNLLRSYYDRMLTLGRERNVGIILDSTSWVANRDRGAALGYSPDQLRDLNKASVEMIGKARNANKDVETVLCAQMGPRADGYVPIDQMSAEEAEAYHCEQMETLSKTPADYVCGTTLCYPQEAIGIARAGIRFNMPVAIAFTIETDGRLPTGVSLQEAIETVDQATDETVQYFIVNCAHPEHIAKALKDEPWIKRLRGFVANASRCSHAELDNAEELDDGDPQEFGKLTADLFRQYPHFSVFGGCCGTDMRHILYACESLRR